jgi:hypothetical protein
VELHTATHSETTLGLLGHATAAELDGVDDAIQLVIGEITEHDSRINVLDRGHAVAPVHQPIKQIVALTPFIVKLCDQQEPGHQDISNLVSQLIQTKLCPEHGFGNVLDAKLYLGPVNMIVNDGL